MELVLTRTIKTEKSTIGKLLIGEGLQLCTLEDVDRGLTQSMSIEEIAKIKVPGKTAIPEGRYKITVTYSPHFKKMLPLLNNVPGYEGVRIHSGNNPDDTLGCILVGESHGNDVVYFSRAAYAELMSRLQSCDDPDDIFITIKSDYK